MIRIEPWKIWLTVILSVISFVYTLPNLFPAAWQEAIEERKLPDFMPGRVMKLGLDLQGGAHLSMQIDMAGMIAESMEDLGDDVRRKLRAGDIGFTDLKVAGETLTLTLRNPSDADKVRNVLQPGPDTVLTIDGAGKLVYGYTPLARKALLANTQEQSIEVIRRRIDAIGTKEPIIQGEGDDRVLIQVPGVENPNELLDLLRQAKLSFHMVVESAGGSPTPGTISRPEANGGRLSIRKRADLTGRDLQTATFGFDATGRPIVNFRLNPDGARKFATLTRESVNKRFAVVLDDTIITAPVINEPITGGSGQISGGFTADSATELALLLRSGALPAKLDVIEQRIVGPTLGADSVNAGKLASLVGFVLVVGFMIATYGRLGVYACLALVVNLAMMVGLLSLLQATLTLPGIAGIILTMGMAVDANILIYERIREEQRNGRSPFAATDAGFSRAFGTIVDGHLTNLMAAAMLFALGSGPVRGFAVSLAIGIITSLFAAIMVTRILMVAWLRRTRPAKLNL